MRKASIYFISLLIFISNSMFAQDTSKSLAFKWNKNKNRIQIVPTSNFNYQLWQRFNLIRDANAGNPVAEHELGIRYLLGDGFDADTLQAANWIKRASDKKFIPAVYNYGILLMNGIAVQWDPFSAYNNFKLAAEKGMREAQFAYGLFFTENLTVKKDMSTAYYWIKLSADNGFEPAKDVLNEFIEIGFIPPKDIISPIKNGRAIYKQDSVYLPSQPIIMPSQSLVYLDLSGDSIPEINDNQILEKAIQNVSFDISKDDSLKHFQTFNYKTYIDSISFSAEAGNPECLTLLGRLYEKGVFYNRDIVKAAFYYLRAIRLDNPYAPSLLWKLNREVNLHRILKAEVDKKNLDANFVWAGLITLGFDGSITGKDAIDLLTKAANNSHIPSMIELGYSYLNGNFVTQDRQKGISLWKKAASLGSDEAIARALLIEASELNFEDLSHSIDFLFTLEEKGSVLAQVILGYFYEKGIGLPQKEGDAVSYYRKAASRGNKIAANALLRMFDAIRPTLKEFTIN